MDSWEERRKQILGKNYTAPASQQNNQNTSQGWEQRRVSILGNNYEKLKQQQKPQSKPVSTQDSIFQKAQQVAGNIFQAGKKFVQDLPNQLGGNYIKDFQKGIKTKQQAEQAVSDIPLFGGMIKGGIDFLRSTKQYTQADVSGIRYNQMQQERLRNQQSAAKLIAQQSQTTDPKKKAQLRKQALTLMGIPAPQQEVMPKDLPTPIQYLGQSIETGLNIGTLALGGEAALSKSFLEKLLSAKLAQSGIGFAYGVSGEMQQKKSSLTSALVAGGIDSVLFPAIIIGGEAVSKVVRKVIQSFTKKSLSLAANATTAEEFIPKFNNAVDSALAKNNSPEVKQGIKTVLENEKKSLVGQENNPEVKQYVQAIDENLKKVSPQSKVARLSQAKTTAKLTQIRSSSTSQDEMISKVNDLVGSVLDKGSQADLVGLRTSLNKDLAAIAGKSGNYKLNYKIIKTLESDPQIGKYVSTLEDHIATLDEEIKSGTRSVGAMTQKDAQSYVTNNFDSMRSNYENKSQSLYGSDNVVSADVAKEAIPGYTGTNADIYHEASSNFANRYYDKLLQENKGKGIAEGKNTVLFSAGGTGAGKTTALEDAGVFTKRYSIVYDTNLSGLDSAERKIQKALDNGYKVSIAFVQRDPEKAFYEGVLPRTARTGRVMLIDEHIARHIGAYDTAIKLQEKFGDKINLFGIDNTGVKGQSKVVEFANLPKFSYNKGELKTKLEAYVNKAQKSGQITEEQAKAIKSPSVSVASRQFESKSPQTKTSKLAQGVEQKAIQNKLTEGFKDLPEYKTVNMKDQSAKVADLISSDPQLAKDIAMGNAKAPEGILPESVFVGVEQQAIKNKDVELLRELATQSSISTGATEMGQRIRALGERNPDSPVALIKQATDERKASLKGKLKGQSVDKAIQQESDKIKMEIDKAAPNKTAWANFIDSIEC